MKRNLRKTVLMMCILTMFLSILAGCGSGATNETSATQAVTQATTPATTVQEGPFKITLMNMLFATEPPKDDNPVIKGVEEYTNTDLEISWVPFANYDDKLNTMIAAADLPMVVTINNNKASSFINACLNENFWEMGPYLKDYTNLGKANQIVLNNISVGGKVYGIYRSRELGRFGFIYRQDWLEALGMQPPKTIDDFYAMIQAFATKDPDKNGKDDTFGLAMSKNMNMIRNASAWFGAPNLWGEDKDGKLQPDYITTGFLDTLKFFKKLYDEKLINQDFGIVEDAKVVEFFETNKAGAYICTVDNANARTANMSKTDPNVKIGMVGALEGPQGKKTMALAGYYGLFVVPKSTVKSEDEFKKILTFFDKINDVKMQDLFMWGIEGTHYKMENGKPVKTNPDLEAAEVNPVRQLMTNIPKQYTMGVLTEVGQRVIDTQNDNLNYLVANPAEPLISETFVQKGPQLEKIMDDARIKFIMGNIDEAGFNAAIEDWKKNGGDAVITEMNTEYAKIKK